MSCADGDCPLEASKRQPLGLENGDPTRAAARPEKERELADTELVDAPTTANAGNGDHDADTLTDRDADGDTLADGDKDAETLVDGEEDAETLRDGDEDAETLREAARDGDRDGVFDADVESDRVKKVEGDFDGENDGDACATARGSREKSTASSAAPRRTRAMAAAS